MSRVAVWMPVFNEAKHLRKAIDSVLAQTYRDFVLYISDNHSTDESRAIIDEYDEIAARVIVLRPDTHLAGIPHMRFMWDSIPKGHEYSIHIGGHDLWRENHLEILVARMDAESKARLSASMPVQPVATFTFRLLTMS